MPERMIRGQYLNQGEDLSSVRKLRTEIFGAGEDEKDPEAVNLYVSLIEGAEDKGIPVGCGRLTLDPEVFRFTIDRVGILEAYRKNGYGEFALRALVDKVNQCGADRVYIREKDLQTEEAERFFRKMFFAPDAENAGLWCAKIEDFHTCCH